MTFGDGLKAKETGCKVCRFIASLPDKQRKTALGYFADDNYSHQALADEMSENGFPASESAVKRHRIRHMRLRVSELR